uniref:Uncharacterized protein n=1 Tax=Timema cristinae TaxID=61476 RepID=A0A7R9DJ99_TIMCR|nr:unnamed protein product [Timema cristinae]
MEQCWSGKPSNRPLLGYVLPLLESIQARYFQKLSSVAPSRVCTTCCSKTTPWQQMCELSVDDLLVESSLEPQ